MNQILALVRRLSGMPDYENYLNHQRERHPDAPVLTEREFFDRYLESRYAGSGSRCC